MTDTPNEPAPGWAWTILAWAAFVAVMIVLYWSSDPRAPLRRWVAETLSN